MPSKNWKGWFSVKLNQYQRTKIEIIDKCLEEGIDPLKYTLHDYYQTFTITERDIDVWEIVKGKPFPGRERSKNATVQEEQ